MNRLLDISRQDGFPWSAETAETLNSNARYVDAIMDGFNIGTRKAIILADNIMYIRESGLSPGKIVKISTRISPPPSRSKLLENPYMYGLDNISKIISINKKNSQTEFYQDCIKEEEYEIVIGIGQNKWEFFDMSYFFERKSLNIDVRYKDVSFVSGVGYISGILSDDFIVRYHKLSGNISIYAQVSHQSAPLSKTNMIIKLPYSFVEKIDFTYSFGVHGQLQREQKV